MNACETILAVYDGGLTEEEHPTMHIKSVDLSLERLREALSYDPLTGKFTWLIAPNRRLKAGTEAGIVKFPRGTSAPGYRYLTLDGVSTPAGRVAWLFLHGEWPETQVQYRDGNSENLREENLTLSAFPTRHEIKDGRRVYKMSKEAQRHYALKRYYGMTPEHYAAMITEQHGVCAICHQPETAMFNGQPKVMHVDHDHISGAIRGLLCGNCNNGLGHFKDSPQTLRAAADYIQAHAAKIVPLKAKDGAA
jgi:hypothetical protein